MMHINCKHYTSTIIIVVYIVALMLFSVYCNAFPQISMSVILIMEAAVIHALTVKGLTLVLALLDIMWVAMAVHVPVSIVI